MTSRVSSKNKGKQAKRKNSAKKTKTKLPKKKKKNCTKKQKIASPGVEPSLSARASNSLTTVPQ